MQKPRNPNEIEDRNRIIIALVVSLIALLGYQHFYLRPRVQEAEAQRLQEAAVRPEAAAAVSAESSAPRPRADVIAADRRLPVEGEKVKGSLSLKGLRLDDLSLKDQYKTVDRHELVDLFAPSGTAHPFYQESGWLSDDKAIRLPSAETTWTLAPGSPQVLKSGGAPLRLQWDNGHGLTFERIVALDAGYLFTITQRVTNRTGQPVALTPYHLVARRGKPADFAGFYVLHEGPVMRLNGKLDEVSYKDLQKGEKISLDGQKGWMGITDKYWMAAVLPEPSRVFSARLIGSPDEHYQADAVGAKIEVASGATAEESVSVYAGVKKPDIMKAYGKAKGFDRLEDAIDYGMWYFITKPFYTLFHIILGAVGQVGLGILAMTVVVRAAMFPLATKAYTSMARMRKIQPLLKDLQERYKDDKPRIQMEMMSLYQREGANPLSGCLPMLVQIPVFFALYKVILISVDLRHAPFYGWIRDLSAPDPTSLFNLFGLIPWTPPQFLMIGAWPVLFCLTMVIQRRLAPAMPDPMQEKIQAYFPYLVTVMMAHFSSGLVIYWTWSNVLAIVQQYYITSKVGGEKVSIVRGHHTRHKPRKGGKTE